MINAQRWLHENHGNLYQISSIVESGQTGLWYCQIVHFHAITKPHPKETNTNCKLQYVVIIVVVVAKNVRISMFSARTSYVNLYSYKFSSIIHSTSYNSVRFNDEIHFWANQWHSAALVYRHPKTSRSKTIEIRLRCAYIYIRKG